MTAALDHRDQASLIFALILLLIHLRLHVCMPAIVRGQQEQLYPDVYKQNPMTKANIFGNADAIETYCILYSLLRIASNYKQLKLTLVKDIDENQLPEVYEGNLQLAPIQGCLGLDFTTGLTIKVELLRK
ncbi:hypothetical protein Tco_0236932 [Tanacetum coccineum]